MDGDEGGEGTGAYTTFTGKAWSEWYPMSVGPGLSSISCPAADFCAGSSYLGVQTFDGLRWSSISQFPLVVSVSCSSAKFCMAVGTQAPFAYPVLYHGSSWVRESGTSLVGDPATVSCVGPTRCVELGYGVAIGAPNPEFVNTYNGTSWSRYSSFRLVGLEGMSCAGPSFCMALVGHGAYELADGSWKVSPLDDPSGVPQSISCATASFCITVDSKGRAFLYS